MGAGVRRAAAAYGAATAESRSGLPDRGEAGPGDDEGSRPSPLPGAGDLRRGDAHLAPGRMGEPSLDLRRLPTGRRAGLPDPGSRTAAGTVEERRVSRRLGGSFRVL